MLDILHQLASVDYWTAFFVALGIATAIQIIPGIGSTVTLAIALPVIVLGVDDPALGIIMLAVITGTSNTFDSIPAQLMGVVSSGTQVTFLEGHQLARKGLGAYSLGAVYAVSAIGGVVGAACLLIAIPFIRPLILRMSFGEIAMIALFGVMMVAVLSKGAVLKGLASGLLGLFAATVGLQAYTGVERFTFGNFDLMFNGLPIVATVVGLMAIPEILDLAVTGLPVAPEGATVTNREVFRGFREGLRRWKMAVRHSIIGVAIGAIPGTGGSAVTWISYAIGMATTKDKSEFGKGSLDGLLFAESSENAKEGGQAIPTLALGIPGSTSWALVLVGMLAYGVTPGPDILVNSPDIVGLIVVSFALANLVLTLLALLVTRQIMRVTRVPYPAVAGVMFPVMLIGAFFEVRSLIVFPVMLIFAILGFAMKQYGWPRPPFVIAFILGSQIEDALHDAWSVHGVGALLRPLTIVIFVISAGITWFLVRAINKGDEVEAQLVEGAESDLLGVGPPGEAGAASVAPSVGTLETQREGTRRRLYWRSEHILPLVLVVVAGWAILEVLEFNRTGARIMPLFALGGVLACSGAQLLIQARSPSVKRGAIMDLDMRSYGVEGTQRSAVLVVGIVGIYGLATYLLGVRWATAVPALLFPLLLLKGRLRVVATVVSVALVMGFVLLVGDELLHVIWPTGAWLG